MVDNATDEEGKEFYTITTPDENIFYLVIDKQKTTDNVYFLNAVTEADLLPLAEKSEEETAEPAPEPEPEPEPTEAPEETAEPEPEAEAPDSNLLAILLVGAVVLIGGGAGYYFKIYKPKHQAPDLEDDYCEYEEEAPEEVVEDYEETADEDTPPWTRTERGRALNFHKQPLERMMKEVPGRGAAATTPVPGAATIRSAREKEPVPQEVPGAGGKAPYFGPAWPEVINGRPGADP